jgi:hypothetical protein
MTGSVSGTIGRSNDLLVLPTMTPELGRLLTAADRGCPVQSTVLWPREKDAGTSAMTLLNVRELHPPSQLLELEGRRPAVSMNSQGCRFAPLRRYGLISA